MMPLPSAPQFPDDENGEVLRDMHQHGDDLTRPRVMDYSFLFAERRQALAFAAVVDDPQLEVCLSFHKERTLWQVLVKRYMVPTHREITAFELALTFHADAQGGEADGWGCLQVDRKDR
jgi:hypothetical protein